MFGWFFQSFSFWFVICAKPESYMHPLVKLFNYLFWLNVAMLTLACTFLLSLLFGTAQHSTYKYVYADENIWLNGGCMSPERVRLPLRFCRHFVCVCAVRNWVEWHDIVSHCHCPQSPIQNNSFLEYKSVCIWYILLALLLLTCLNKIHP